MNEGCTSMSAAALRKVGSTRCRSVREIVGEVAIRATVAAGCNDCNHRTGSNRLVHGYLGDIAVPGEVPSSRLLDAGRGTLCCGPKLDGRLFSHAGALPTELRRRGC